MPIFLMFLMTKLIVLLVKCFFLHHPRIRSSNFFITSQVSGGPSRSAWPRFEPVTALQQIIQNMRVCLHGVNAECKKSEKKIKVEAE